MFVRDLQPTGNFAALSACRSVAKSLRNLGNLVSRIGEPDRVRTCLYGFSINDLQTNRRKHDACDVSQCLGMSVCVNVLVRVLQGFANNPIYRPRRGSGFLGRRSR